MENDFFFVVGAPKAGTTSLYNYLKQHPNVYLPEQKEMHFFSQPEVLNTYYSTDKMVKTIEEYEKYYRDSKRGQVCGDITPSYLYNINSASKIYNFNPNAKIIIILRDPIERAISHYLMDVREGLVSASLMDILLNKEKYPLYYKEYVEVGRYDLQIKSYRDVFPEDQILILHYESFFNDVEKGFSILSDFLKLYPVALDFSKKSNVYRKTRFNILKHYRSIPFLRFIDKLLSKKIKVFLLEKVIYKSAKKPLLKNEREVLKKIFESY